MKINPISTRIILNTKSQNTQNNSMVNFAAKPLKPLSKEFYQAVMGKRGNIAPQQLRQLRMLELRILNFRAVSSTSVSGGTFSVRPDIDLRALKEAGFKTIVDFRGEATNDFAKKCEKYGFRYFNFNLNNVIKLSNPEYFIREKNKKIEISPKFVENLLEFFAILEEGDVYMGCQFGIDRTNMHEDNAPTVLPWP